MGKLGQVVLLFFLSSALVGCSSKNEPVAENEKSKEPNKASSNKPAKEQTAPEKKEQKPKPSGNTENKKPEKKPDNKKQENKPDKKQNTPSKGKPTTEEQLLVLINKGIEKTRYDFSLDEELEKRHKEFLPILLKMAADGNLALPQRAAAIVAMEDLMLLGNDKEKAERTKKVAAVLAPILKEAANPAAPCAAAAIVLSDRDAYPESVAVWEAGITQTDSPMVQIMSITKAPEESKKKLLPQLIPMMRSPNSEMAMIAIANVWLLKEAADAAVPTFVELLKDPNHPQLDDLLFGLGKIGTRPELTLPVLKSYAEKPDSHNYSNAAKSLTEVLAKNNLDVTPYIPTLQLALERGSETQRGQTLSAFETLGPKAAPLIPLVLKSLNDKSEGVQGRAIDVLKEIGPAAKPAVEELKKRLAAPDAKHRDKLIDALRAIVPDDPSVPKE